MRGRRCPTFGNFCGTCLASCAKWHGQDSLVRGTTGNEMGGTDSLCATRASQLSAAPGGVHVNSEHRTPEHSFNAGDGMKRRRVDEILQPYNEEVPLEPSVEMGERIIDAIQLMVTNDLKFLAVTINKRPVGVVRLEDAFKKVGLHVKNQ